MVSPGLRSAGLFVYVASHKERSVDMGTCIKGNELEDSVGCRRQSAWCREVPPAPFAAR